jgi:septation ring formation regulator EzrA
MCQLHNPAEKDDIKKTLEEVRLFLNLIDENSNNILQDLSLKTEHRHLNENDIAFFCRLEEDTEEIKKALNAIKDLIDKIAHTRS